MLTAPSKTNKYYISTGWKKAPGPGYNRCVTYVNGSCLPNCVGYAWGRFMELGGVTTCTLSRSNAKDWYPNRSDGYSRGLIPQVGAVMCWRTRGEYGHVAIVEEVYSDNSVLISESAHCGDDVVYDPSNSRHWKTQIIKCKNGEYPTPYANFQGFIYNPYVSSSNKNISNEFIKQIETDIETICITPVEYIQRCASVLNTSVLAAGGDCNGVILNSVRLGLGRILDQYSIQVAQPCDILLIQNNPKGNRMIDKLAVVIEVLSRDVRVVTTRYRPETRDYRNYQTSISFSDERVIGVYRPTFGNAITYTRDDAMVREFANLNDRYEPSINVSSTVKLSLINYESAYNFVQAISGKDPEETKRRIITMMMSVPRIIITYLMYYNLSIAGSIAICANMYVDSKLSADMIIRDDRGTPIQFGLCLWSGGRAKQLQKNSDWSTISSQIQFLINELRTANKYLGLYEYLKGTDSPQSATRRFASTYYDKAPSDVSERVKVAELLWSCTEVIEE